MNAVFVPALPQAIFYMRNFSGPPWHGCRGKTLFQVLGECSEDNKCFDCPFLEECEKKYQEIIESGEVINWRGTERNVARYLK